MEQTVTGKYNTAKIFTDVVEQSALDQIKTLCDQPFTQNSRIRIMPDVHAGAGCTIGTTMTVSDTIVPNLVGVDIGCGMEVVRLRNKTHRSHPDTRSGSLWQSGSGVHRHRELHLAIHRNRTQGA